MASVVSTSNDVTGQCSLSNIRMLSILSGVYYIQKYHSGWFLFLLVSSIWCAFSKASTYSLISWDSQTVPGKCKIWIFFLQLYRNSAQGHVFQQYSSCCLELHFKLDDKMYIAVKLQSFSNNQSNNMNTKLTKRLWQKHDIFMKPMTHEKTKNRTECEQRETFYYRHTTQTIELWLEYLRLANSPGYM